MVNYTLSRYFITLHEKMEQYFETLTVRVKNVIITGDLRLFCKESW